MKNNLENEIKDIEYWFRLQIVMLKLFIKIHGL